MNKRNGVSNGIRRSISLLLSIVMLGALTGNAVSKPCEKIWIKPGPKTYNWDYRYLDQWGGENEWCILPGGNQCSHYSWRALYSIDENDPCPENNHSGYGETLITQEAVLLGIELPEGLPPATFELIME